MKNFLKEHGLWVLFAAAVIAVVLAVMSVLSYTSSPLVNAANTVAAPFRAAYTAVADWFNDKQNYYRDTTALEEENAALRRQLAEMEDAIRQAEADSADSLYLESFFLRSENGKSYVMVRGENDKLEKRWVQTGRDLWGSYTQIRGGLTLEDYVAFPYGRDVVEGAHTQEATADQLYNGM